jgi:hypothetical protein
MIRFLLAGTRPPGCGEQPLAAAAHDVVTMARWNGWLRRWGLLLSFGLPLDPVGELRACLIVLASDDQAAERLAAGWKMVSGYQVAVLPLSDESAGETGR